MLKQLQLIRQPAVLTLLVVGLSLFAFSDQTFGLTLMQSDESLPAANAVSDAEVDQSATEDQARPGLSFLNLMYRGGWFMIPLGLLSLVVLTLGIERSLALRRDRLFPDRLIGQLSKVSQLEGGLDPRVAYQICQKFPSSASYVLRAVLTRVGRPQSELQSCMHESTQREATRLNQLGSWLTLAAAVAPLIGLLGTVWGITQAFYDTTQLVEGQNRAEALAQGIYTALVTTMVGLMIAIPAAVLAHFFENRIVNTMNQIEEMISNLLPQFERYEGQLRFAADGVEDSALHEASSSSEPVLERVESAARRNGAEEGLPTIRPK